MKAFHDHIGLRQQFEKNLASPQGFQIEGEAFFVRIEMQKQAALFRVRYVVRKRAETPARIAAVRPFNLNHTSPVIRQTFRTIRAGNIVREIEYE
jgi:hypothetical protein